VAKSDPIAEIIGDYRAFAAMQRDRLVARGFLHAVSSRDRHCRTNSVTARRSRIASAE
jgi:hypothetical protein